MKEFRKGSGGLRLPLAIVGYWHRAVTAAALILIVSILMACSGGSPTARRLTPQRPGQAVGPADYIVRGAVVLSPETRAALRTQASESDVVQNALVSIIDPTTNLAIATGLTDANGNFSLPTPAESTFATTGTIYILDATKGLPFPRPNFPQPTPVPTPTPLNFAAGAKAPRMRTYVKWTGTAWESIAFCTASGSNYNYITADTTALSIIIGQRSFTPANALGTITVATNCGLTGPTFNAYAGGDTEISTFIQGAVKTLVNSVLQNNEDDPIAMIVYRNGTYINRKSTTVNLGASVSTMSISGATIANPRGITFDGASNLYLVQDSATAGADTILQINKSTGAACILVIGTSQTGNCASVTNACSNCATNVAMTNPEYIAYDTGRSSTKTGFLYFSDPGNVTIKQLDLSALTASGGTTAVTTLATSTSGDGLTTPRGLVYDGGDFIYFVQPDELLRLSLAASPPAPNPCILASKNTGACTCGGTPGTTCKDSALPELQDPRGITFDQANNLLYMSSFSRNDVSIYNLNTPGQDVQSLGFSAASTGYVDGNNSDGKMANPTDVYYDGGTFIYVADKLNHLIRLLDLKSGTATAAVTTYAGKQGVTGTTDSVGLAARFNLPAYLTFDSSTLFVVDSGNNAIRKIR